jgi:hypothetical protein
MSSAQQSPLRTLSPVTIASGDEKRGHETFDSDRGQCPDHSHGVGTHFEASASRLKWVLVMNG